jgi:serine/threonine protein kinase
MAPELCLGETYNEKIDIWSIGIITYMLLIGEKLFDAVEKK